MRHPVARLAALAAAVLIAAAAPAVAAESTPVRQDVDSSGYPRMTLTVALPAELMARGGAQPTFLLEENGVEIDDVSAEPAVQERAPVDVVLVFDVSGSMEGEPLGYAKQAAKDFFAAMGESDRIAVVSFADAPVLVADFTADRDALETAVDSLGAAGETALYDGLVRAADVLATSDADQRYIVVLSDGGDTVSNNSLGGTSEALSESGVPLYAVALESPEFDPEPLRSLAGESEGKVVSAASATELTSVYQDIAQELRNLYVVTYTSLEPNTRDLEIALAVIRGPDSGTLVTVVDNPAFDAAAAVGAALAEPVGPTQQDQIRLALAVGLGALSVILLIVVLGLIVQRDAAAVDQLDYYRQGGPSTSEHDAVERPSGVRERVMGAVGYVSERRGLAEAMRLNLQRAGLPLRPNEYLLFHTLTALFIGGFVQVVWGSFLVTTIVVLLVVIVPVMWIGRRISKRRTAFEEQLPDVLTLIAGSLRSGWGLQQAMDLAIGEIGEPASSEFQRVQSETRLGLGLEDALARMAERVDSDDFRWTVAAISIQREVGGDLAEVLDIVAGTIRERAELDRHVQALTAEGRFSAIALVLIPVVVFLVLLLTNPDYVLTLFNTSVGITLLVIGAVLMVIGILWLRRYTRVEV